MTWGRKEKDSHANDTRIERHCMKSSGMFEVLQHLSTLTRESWNTTQWSLPTPGIQVALQQSTYLMVSYLWCIDGRGKANMRTEPSRA